MYIHSSSVPPNYQLDMTNDNGLTLVEPRRTEGTVALRVDSLSKRYGATITVEDVSLTANLGSQLSDLLTRVSIDDLLTHMRRKYGNPGREVS